MVWVVLFETSWICNVAHNVKNYVKMTCKLLINVLKQKQPIFNEDNLATFNRFYLKSFFPENVFFYVKLIHFCQDFFLGGEGGGQTFAFLS